MQKRADDEEKAAKDEARDMWLRRRGIEVIRISAGSVYRDLSGVADSVILTALGRIAELRSPG